MVSLEQPRRVRSELLKLLLEELLLVIGDGFLVQDQDLRNIIVVNLYGRLARVECQQPRHDKPCLSGP